MPKSTFVLLAANLAAELWSIEVDRRVLEALLSIPAVVACVEEFIFEKGCVGDYRKSEVCYKYIPLFLIKIFTYLKMICHLATAVVCSHRRSIVGFLNPILANTVAIRCLEHFVLLIKTLQRGFLSSHIQAMINIVVHAKLLI